MLSNIRVQVVILTYKSRFELLKKVIESLDFELCINDILLVDNGCDYDLSYEISVSNLSKLIRVIKIIEPIGTSKAFNESFRQINSESTHVLLLDDDNVMDGSLSSIEFLLHGNNVVNLLRIDREPYASAFKEGKKLKFVKNSFYGFSLSNYLSQYFSNSKVNAINFSAVSNEVKFIETDYLPFGGTLFPVNLLRKLSLNENFILYHDDIDFFSRSKSFGYKLMITSLCRIKDIDFSWHNRNLSLLDSILSNPENIYYAIRNKIYLEKKYSNSIFLFYINMFIWKTFFSLKYRKRRSTSEYLLLNQAINDALNGKLGVFQK